MTQKAALFKGQKKRKTIPPSRHGKAPKTRKGLFYFYFCKLISVVFQGFIMIFIEFAGKRVIKPAKVTKEMDTEHVSYISFLYNFYNLKQAQ